MRGNRKPLKIAALSTVAALLCAMVFAAGAGASPAWFFNGVELSGGEAVLAESPSTTITLPGLVTTCEKTPSGKMTIGNTAGLGEAGFPGPPFGSCSTSDEACSVGAISPLNTPWMSYLATVGKGNYMIFEEIGIEILFVGEECVLDETVITIEGSAGARFDNSKSTFSFDPSSSAATGTELSALGYTVYWEDVFTVKAIGSHKGQVLTVG